MPIYFYNTRDTYGCFSNFSAHGFELDGLYWKTSEQYFQAQKFAGHPKHLEAIRLAKTPKEAATMGRERTRPLRKDWESVKDDMMRKAVLKSLKPIRIFKRFCYPQAVRNLWKRQVEIITGAVARTVQEKTCSAKS
jgi:ribA/ribD-fused uncharacterized protein